MKTLDQTLELFASRPADEAAVQEAQRKLETLIASRRTRVRVPATRGWLAAAVSVALVVVSIIWLPLTPTPALAFSAVQRQLRDFTTLSMVIDQRVNGAKTLQTRVAMTHDGNVRTEVGSDIVVVVNSAEMRVLTLVKPARVASVKPLDKRVEKSDQLEWLQEIRDFQGMATKLGGTRVIDGQKAHGWKLEINQMEMVMWATAEGIPLEMAMEQGKTVQLDFHFEMNRPLAAELFSTRVPAGYRLGDDED
jgi:hypothetical protein